MNFWRCSGTSFGPPVSLDELLRALSDLALETAHDATAATDDHSNGD
jgi:hypothetical protein